MIEKGTTEDEKIVEFTIDDSEITELIKNYILSHPKLLVKLLNNHSLFKDSHFPENMEITLGEGKYHFENSNKPDTRRTFKVCDRDNPKTINPEDINYYSVSCW